MVVRCHLVEKYLFDTHNVQKVICGQVDNWPNVRVIAVYCVDQMSVGQMSVDQMSVDQMSVGQMSVRQMSVDKMSAS